MRDPLAPLLVEAGERARRHHQTRLDLLARDRADAGESDEDSQRAAAVVIRSLQVQLHDLTARSLARVADGDSQMDVLVRRNLLRRGYQRLVAPVRVAQAVSEAEERLGAVSVIAAIAHQQTLGINAVAGLTLSAMQGRGCFDTR